MDIRPSDRLQIERQQQVRAWDATRNLVGNSHFGSGTTGWTGVRSTLSVIGGQLVITGTANYPGAYTVVQTTPGKSYRACIQFVDGNGKNAKLFAKNGTDDNAPNINVSQSPTAANQVIFVDFVAGGSFTTLFAIADIGSTVTMSVDNVVCFERYVSFDEMLDPTRASSKPKRLIIDTDISTDVGDAGCLAVAIALARSGEIEIEAITTCASNDYGAPCVRAILNTYGMNSVPVGAYKGALGPATSDFAATVASEFGQSGKTRADFEDPVNTLRRSLGCAQDNSIIFYTNGFLMNVEELLKSNGDVYSPLSGIELVRRKVKFFVVMGGDYPTSAGIPNFGQGANAEWNFAWAAAAANYVMINCPVDMIFLGYTVGGEQQCGPPAGANPALNPIRRAYNLQGITGSGKRTAWDECALLWAARGNKSGFYVQFARGTNDVDPATGRNTFNFSLGQANRHSYLERSASSASINSVLDALIASIGP